MQETVTESNGAYARVFYESSSCASRFQFRTISGRFLDCTIHRYPEIKIDRSDSPGDSVRVTIVRVPLGVAWAGFRTVTWQAASRQASEGTGRQAGRQARQASRLATRDWNVSRPLESALSCSPPPLLLSPLSAFRPAVGPIGPTSRLVEGPGGIDVVRGVVADGWEGERGALTPFFRASIHREEKMPVPPGSLSFRVSPLRIFRPFFLSPFLPFLSSLPRDVLRRFLPHLPFLSLSFYPVLSFIFFFRLSLFLPVSRNSHHGTLLAW